MRAWGRGEQRLSASSGGGQGVVYLAYGDPTFTNGRGHTLHRAAGHKPLVVGGNLPPGLLNGKGRVGYATAIPGPQDPICGPNTPNSSRSSPPGSPGKAPPATAFAEPDVTATRPETAARVRSRTTMPSPRPPDLTPGE